MQFKRRSHSQQAVLHGTILEHRSCLASNVFVYTKTLALQELVGRSPNPLFCLVPMQASHFCKMLFQHSAGVRSHHGSVMFAGIGIASQQTEHARQGFNAVRVLWPLYAQRHCLQKLNKKAERKYYTVLEFKILMMALAIVVASSSVFCLPKETRIVPRAYSSER